MNHLLLTFALTLSFLTAAIPQTADSSKSLPAVEQVLEKYVRAIGGREAYQRLTSRIARGEWENATRGVRFRIEIYSKAPDRRVETLDAPENRGFTGRGYDGANGWSMNLTETGLRQLEGAELATMRRESDFYREIELEQLYRRLAVIAKEKMDAREVYVVEATPEIGNSEKLYFDIETGLLIRRDMVYGTTLVKHYYEDYREVDGVKLPFAVRSEGPVRVTTRLKEVKHNIAIEDSKFKSPSY
ncbi:MAG TPA: hypothetical protein VLM38_00555 [Blastocatellia bacterium]|nr:hypothetical protein [Blastocatellia bacterium]